MKDLTGAASEGQGGDYLAKPAVSLLVVSLPKGRTVERSA
jgi:hypothetical protein